MTDKRSYPDCVDDTYIDCVRDYSECGDDTYIDCVRDYTDCVDDRDYTDCVDDRDYTDCVDDTDDTGTVVPPYRNDDIWYKEIFYKVIVFINNLWTRLLSLFGR
jgi:hypothetical protein